MSPEQFFELMLKELEVHTELRSLYKFLDKKSSWHFRRNYFLERLRYISKYIVDGPDFYKYRKEVAIWDCGCGYGTTCLFLAMNDINTFGNTLEFYFSIIQKRKEYWRKYGDTSLFCCAYENLFDKSPTPASYDWIIVQDTLHHLEPIDDALRIFNYSLKKNGKILCLEENGNNVVNRIRLYKYRGNKRIITIWDERLHKYILIGNENIRSLGNWQNLFEKNDFLLLPDSVQYIRYYLPFQYRFSDSRKLLRKEQQIQKSKRLRREYLFFGFNFIAEKNSNFKGSIDFRMGDVVPGDRTGASAWS
jgi:SAM-dependent methyltransferase